MKKTLNDNIKFIAPMDPKSVKSFLDKSWNREMRKMEMIARTNRLMGKPKK